MNAKCQLAFVALILLSCARVTEGFCDLIRLGVNSQSLRRETPVATSSRTNHSLVAPTCPGPKVYLSQRVSEASRQLIFRHLCHNDNNFQIISSPINCISSCLIECLCLWQSAEFINQSIYLLFNCGFLNYFNQFNSIVCRSKWYKQTNNHKKGWRQYQPVSASWHKRSFVK